MLARLAKPGTCTRRCSWVRLGALGALGALSALGALGAFGCARCAGCARCVWVRKVHYVQGALRARCAAGEVRSTGYSLDKCKFPAARVLNS